MSDEQEQLSTPQEESASAARDEAIAMLEAEMAKAESAEATPAVKTVPAKVETKVEEPAKAEEPEEAKSREEENRIAVVMRARRQAQKVRDEAQAAAAERQRELDERARKLEEREQSVKSKLRERPIEALLELGIDPHEFFTRAVEDPKQLDPIQQTRAEVEALKRQLAEREERERQREEHARRAQVEAARQRDEQAAVQHFLGEALTDKFPTLSSVYADEPEELASKAIRVVKLYAERGGDPSELSNAEIAAYLEDQERQKYSRLKGRLEQVGSEAAQPAGGNVAITQKDAAQKRSRPKKSVAEMTPEERRAEAIRALEAGEAA